MLCSRYGPASLALKGGRIYLVNKCDKYVELEEFIKYVKIDPAHPLTRLLGIRRGSATSYKVLATTLRLHPRAVGRLLAENPYPVVLPCHRVVRSDRSLGGFSYGLELKRALLAYEGVEFCGEKVCRLSAVEDVGDLEEALLRSLGLR
ncbi:MAG: MGMT family protein [Thermoproteus sp.]